MDKIEKLLEDILDNGECNYSKHKVLEIIELLDKEVSNV